MARRPSKDRVSTLDWCALLLDEMRSPEERSRMEAPQALYYLT